MRLEGKEAEETVHMSYIQVGLNLKVNQLVKKGDLNVLSPCTEH